MAEKTTIRRNLLLCSASLLIALLFTGGKSGECIRSVSIPGDMGSGDTLKEHFLNPPKEYTILPFWSWNNTLVPQKLNWQMDQMLDKGIYGAFMHARAGIDSSATPYFSKGWWDAVASTVKHASEKGFYACLYDEDKWPSGSAGGRTIAPNPGEFVKKYMHYDAIEVIGPQTIRLDFIHDPYAIFAAEITERGLYDYRSQVDITTLAGKEWKVPEGRWAIITLKMLRDPHEQINYLDTAAVASFLHVTHDQYYKRFASYFGNTIPGVFFDEIYASPSDRLDNLIWTDDFAEQFRKQKGYELRDKLPLIVLDDPGNSSQVRYDYFDVARDLYSKAWFKQYAGWGTAHHIWVTGHTTELMSQYTRQADYFYTMGQLQRPGTDNEDFRYSYPRHIDFYSPKQISSIGHLYGKKRVMAESMGSGGYTIPLEEYRYGASMLGVYGINMYVAHLFHYSLERPENQADWPPSWFYRNPYWKYFKPLAEYMQRLSYMNSCGVHVCDIAVLYPLTDLWLSGWTLSPDNSFYRELQRILLEHHMDYDVVDPTSLANARVDSLGLFMGSEHYKILVLPSIKALSAKVLDKVREFTAHGGIVVGVDGLPQASEKMTPVDPYTRQWVLEVFGFDPRDLKSHIYHTWGKEKIRDFTLHNNPNGGKGIFTWYVEELPDILSGITNPDIEVTGTGNEWLQYNHHHVGNREVYFLVNSHYQADTLTISLRTTGIPWLWHPETKEIREITNYRVKNGRMQLVLDFAPWEAYYLVVEPGKFTQNDILVQSTDLEDAGLRSSPEGVAFAGWAPADEIHHVTYVKDDAIRTKTWKTKQSLPSLAAGNLWNFQLSRHSLDYTWAPSVKDDTLELPVMKFKPLRAGEKDRGNQYGSQAFHDDSWETVKIEDRFNHIPGVRRYMSDWDALWISYYDYRMHIPDISGGMRWFRKRFVTEDGVTRASLDMTADKSYELFVNGKPVGRDGNWKDVEHYDITQDIVHGPNEILVKTADTRGLLLQGSVTMKNGALLELRSDSSWQASEDQVNWLQAFLFAAPPLGSWGNIHRPGHEVHYPITVWYRQELPPGTESILKPDISGRYQVFANGKPVSFGNNGVASVAILMKSDKNSIAVRVELKDENDGILKPLRVVCGETMTTLMSWTGMGLEWYSGRAIYSRNVQIPGDYLNNGTRLILDLGRVDYFAEIWVNDKLVTFRPWAPFRADITSFLHTGTNKINIVVANLLANTASWNILDANIDNRDARWWQNGSIMREKEKLVSGLLGPVTIIPYVKEEVILDTENNNTTTQ